MSEKMTKGLIEKAEEFATEAHKGQKRKGGKQVPYITHPLAVADILKSINAPAEIVIGGLLHDVVEDTDITLHEIGQKFGKQVMTIVDYVTEKDTTFPVKGIERKKSWKSRKVEYIYRIKDAPYQAVIVAAADKLHNLRDTLEDFEKHGDGVWKMFNSQKDSQFWYYTTLISVFHKREVPEVILDEMRMALSKIHERLLPDESVQDLSI
jgi:(p)ppGpp synthase/HD superfamily hydrolase